MIAVYRADPSWRYVRKIGETSAQIAEGQKFIATLECDLRVGTMVRSDGERETILLCEENDLLPQSLDGWHAF